MRTLRLPIAALVALMSCAACSTASDNSAAIATKRSGERPEMSDGPRSTPDGATPGGSIDWSSCEDDMAAAAGLDCAVLDVPLDPSVPDGPTTELALARQPSTGSADDRIGSLILNPGGPGGSGIEFLASAAAAFPEDLTDRFDLVSFDPRGVAASSPVRCVDDATKEEELEGDLSPDTAEELERAAASQRKFLAGCEQNSSDMVRHMSTADVAADVDRIREAVGDDQLTYLGYSYGTEIGAAYATLFPGSTRALVLDGSISPTATDEQEATTQASGFENTLANFVSACNGDSSCALGPDAASAIATARASLDADPVRVSTDSGDRTMGVDLFDFALATSLYDTSVWGTTAEAIRDIRSGGAALMFSLADRQLGRQPDGTFDNSSDAQSMVNCADTAERPTIEEATAAAERIMASAPIFGATVAWSMLGCVGWPQPANPLPPLTGAGAPTVLVIGTRGDPATPYEWAQQMAESLENAELLTYEGDGHTAFLRGGPCIDDAVVGYLVDLDVPAPGTSCPATSDGVSFGGLRDEIVSQLVDGGLPDALAECVIDGVIDQIGAAEFNRMVLEQDSEALTRLVTAQTLGCASAGG